MKNGTNGTALRWNVFVWQGHTVNELVIFSGWRKPVQLSIPR